MASATEQGKRPGPLMRPFSDEVSQPSPISSARGRLHRPRGCLTIGPTSPPEDITTTQEPNNPIIITVGLWQHIRRFHAYHRHYPEIRGEGGSRAEAIAHLTNQLVRAHDSIPCQGDSEAFQQALTDVRAIGSCDSQDPIDVIPRRRNGHEIAHDFRE